MTASTGFLGTLVLVCLIVTAAAPVVLLVMLVQDWRKRNLW